MKPCDRLDHKAAVTFWAGGVRPFVQEKCLIELVEHVGTVDLSVCPSHPREIGCLVDRDHEGIA